MPPRPNRRRARPAPSFARPRSDGTSAYRPVTRYPIGTVMWHGPTNTRATKVVVGVIRDRFGKVEPMESWFALDDQDLRDDPTIEERIEAFFAPHNVTIIANNRQITGCPHIEGEDYPDGQDCPRCSYWQHRDRWTGERRFRSPTAEGALDESGGEFDYAFADDADDPWADERFPQYDPDDELDVDQWLALDDDERTGIIMTFHRRAAIPLLNRRLHGSMHLIIENQIAVPDEAPTARVVERLSAEGLSRHDAIHAAGDVLLGQLLRLMGDKDATTETRPDQNTIYFAALEAQTAAKWLASGDEDDEDDEAGDG